MDAQSRFIVALLAAASLQTVARGQESRALLDAPLVVGDDLSRFEVIADLDGDGFDDAVSAWWKNSNFAESMVVPWINDQTGAFTPGAPLQVNVDFPHEDVLTPFTGGAIDVDHDAREDFWMVWHGLDDTKIVAYTSNGSGSPSPVADLSWFGPRSTDPVFADFNGDGEVDRAMIEGQTLRIFLRGPNAPLAGSMIETTTLNLGRAPHHMILCDANGDSQPDLAAVTGQLLLIITQENGVAARPVVRPHGILSNAMLIAGDVDGDQDEDLAIFGPVQHTIARRVSATEFVIEPAQVGGPAAKFADVDSDGDLDGICCGGGGPGTTYNSEPSTFMISLNDGTGSFAPAFSMPGLGSREIAGASDVDHDGDMDLIAGRCVYYNKGTLTESPWRSLPPMDLHPHGVWDLEGDGDPDFDCGASNVRINQGDGTFVNGTAHLPPPPPGRTFVGPGWPGDWDGDGNLDLIVGLEENGTIVLMRLLTGTGQGVFRDRGNAAPPGVDFRAMPTGDFSPAASVAGDADGDGDLDLVTRTRAGSGRLSRLWLNNGDGTFVHQMDFPGKVIHFVGDLWPFSSAYPDLLAGSQSGFSIHPATGLLQWNLNGGVYFPSEEDLHDQVLPIVDIDNDGDVDWVNLYQGQTAYVQEQNPQSNGWQESYLLSTTEFFSEDAAPGASTGDVNGDGRTDVFVTSPIRARNAVAIHLQHESMPGFEEEGIIQTVFPSNGSTVIASLGISSDLDGDGDADFLVRGRWIPATTYHGESAGSRKQTGMASPDIADVTPTLGAVGPFRVDETVELRLRAAPAGAIGTLDISSPDPGGAPLIPGLGLSTPVVATGSGFAPGTGEWSHSFSVPFELAGATLHAVVELPSHSGSEGIVQTNVVELVFGP